jgi:type I restriction enzyme R subunit
MTNYISEDQIEKSVVRLLADEFGYRSLDCFVQKTEELEAANDRSGRADKADVVFTDLLSTTVRRLNHGLPPAVTAQALETLLARRVAMSPLQANREIYQLIRNGIPVRYDDGKGRPQEVAVKIVDFERPDANDFLSVTQLWVKGERGYRRPDLLIYLNGLPLFFFEFKDANVSVENAYWDNLATYKEEIPRLFAYNAFCVLSNAAETRLGSFSSGWEFFFPWLRPNDEKQKIDRRAIHDSGTSLERLLRGLFPKDRLLDYLENFILFSEDKSKVIAQNHQFLGVNRAIESFRGRKGKKGRLGVFWHTQGSGKSFSMIFLARKIFHSFKGNYTFVIVTDRVELDGQIYRNFLSTDTVSRGDAAQPASAEQLRDFLKTNKRLIFTLIQKFRYDSGKEFPLLSERDDIIVIVDEAHRTQYASLAENMRKGLPYAQYFAFTGTPLLGRGERLHHGKTFEWFGGYVSEYSFSQSVDDGATVPLYYQKRLPEVLIQNQSLDEDFYRILEEEDLDGREREKLETQFSTQMEIIKRDDRLETIARDIVAHFPNRGYLGKGMVVCVDKFTAVRIMEKVERLWKEAIRETTGAVSRSFNALEKDILKRKLDYLRSLEMAVVVSGEAGETEKFTAQGLDIKRHRVAMDRIDENGHDIETRFKDPQDPLQLVFVCAMWLTGFDAPSVSTLYLDKPMKGHTLMQAIARANRVCGWKINGVVKANGEIVDYINVFRSMKRALADFSESGEETEDAEVPDKSALLGLLEEAVSLGKAYCSSMGADMDAILEKGETFSKLGLFKSYADALLAKDEYWKQFKVHENAIASLYEACKPEVHAHPARSAVAAFSYLRGVIDASLNENDLLAAKYRIGELLDASVVAEKDSLFTAGEGGKLFDIKKGKLIKLNALDPDKLKKEFKTKRFKNIEIADLREFLKKKLEQMMRENASRAGFASRLQNIIDTYNSGGMNTENFYDELLAFTKDLGDEETRAVREGLSEEELELFDILKKEAMTQDETVRVKNASRHLLKRLREGRPKVIVPAWFKDVQTKLRVKSAIEDVLNEDLPESYDPIFKEKSLKVYELVEDYAARGLRWAS